MTQELTRRRLLGLGIAATGGAVVLGSAQLVGASVAGAVAAKHPTLAQWKPLVGKTVTFHTNSGRQVKLTLHAASALRHDKRLTGSGYALLLRGPRHPVLEPTAGTLHHRSLGRQSAILLPVNQPGRRQAYQFIVDGRRPVASARR